MARVYLAISQKQLGFTKLVVLKVLRDELDADGEFLAMFIQEARLAARLNHPNVVQTYEAGEDGGAHYIAMEYLEGQPLSAVLAQIGREKLALDVHLRILCDALEGLHYAHELADYDGTALGIVHRDVSPQNVFVTYTGQSKILDFGIAKTTGSTRTINGILKGKAGYMAPEQATSAPTDRRTDLFAVGVMLWEALAARRFVQRGEEDIVALTRRIAGKEPRIREVAPDAPPDLADICDKAMATDPSSRYASAAEMRDAIEAHLRTRAPVDRRNVAAVLEAAFASERARMHRLVDERVKAAFHTGPMIELQTGATVTPPRHQPSFDSVSSADDEAKETVISSALTGERPLQSPAGARRRSFSAALVALIAVLFVSTVAIGLTYKRTTGTGATSTSTSPSVSASSLPLVTASAAEQAPHDELPRTYRLRLTSEPSGARVYEGESLFGPTPVELPMDNGALRAGTRHLLLRAEGFEPHAVVVAPSPLDVTTHVVLVPTSKPTGGTPALGGKPRGTANGPAASGKAPAPTVTPDPKGAVSPPNGLRPLDDGNPWEKTK
jgi:serine/threonine-protein kinase